MKRTIYKLPDLKVVLLLELKIRKSLVARPVPQY